MFRKLLILGTITALFTILTAAPAFGIAVETGDPNDPVKTVLDNETEGGVAHPAHGQLCGADDPGVQCEEGVPTGNPSGLPGISAPGVADDPDNQFGANVGAWNAVAISNDNSAICGVTADGC